MCRTLGCCIGFRREVLGDKFKFVDDYHKLPFDYSITLFALAYFNCFFSSKAFHQYRRHNLNISSGGAKSTNSFFKMLIFRLRVLVFVLNAFPEHFLKRKAKFFLGDSH